MTDWEKRLNEAAIEIATKHAFRSVNGGEFVPNGTVVDPDMKDAAIAGANWARQQDLELRKEMLSVLDLVEESLTGLRPVVTILPRLAALREKARGQI